MFLIPAKNNSNNEPHTIIFKPYGRLPALYYIAVSTVKLKLYECW